ncbi:MAG: hypothetical protein KBF88_11560, partial [Polyangiaceae bacterium]|nr:hypothetical protein [Polyangiaceae bacterium]
ARSNTAQVKLLPGNPNFAGSILYEKVLSQIRTFYFQILNGEVWSAEFIPEGARPFFIMGLLSLLILGFQRRQMVRACVVVGLALAMLIPCVYYTFLWNRLRYLWPFVSGWLLSLVALAEVSAQIVSDLRKKVGSPRDGEAVSNGVAFCLVGVTLGLFLAKTPSVVTDIGQSAFEIDGQQVKIGKWAATELPSNARIGVNDTGAIAYFSGHKTFDIVGLTTTTEPKYWVAGPGSRFEHYENLHRSGRTFPTHFAVYPNWMGFDALFGDSLFEATVPNATILGGETMRVYDVNHGWLDSGARPDDLEAARIMDELDVADLESEERHGYKLGIVREGENVLVQHGRIVDGGRVVRTESFRTSGEGTSWISRVQCSVSSERTCSLRGTEVRDSLPPGLSEVERIVSGTSEVLVSCTYSQPCTVAHHWWLERKR